MKALSLSEQALLHRHGYNVELEDLQRAWNDEKASLLSAINSLKELLAETHKGRDPSKVRQDKTYHRNTQREGPQQGKTKQGLP